MGTPAILFDDAKGLLSPMNDLRAAYEIRTGAMTTAERLLNAFDLEPVGVMVPTPLVELIAETTPVPVNRPPDVADDAEILLINGRCPLPLDAIGGLDLGEAGAGPRSRPC